MRNYCFLVRPDMPLKVQVRLAHIFAVMALTPPKPFGEGGVPPLKTAVSAKP